jgi:hypothetical protein
MLQTLDVAELLRVRSEQRVKQIGHSTYKKEHVSVFM